MLDRQSLIRAEARAHNWPQLRIDVAEAYPELEDVWDSVDVLLEAPEELASEVADAEEARDRAEGRLSDAHTQAARLEAMVTTLAAMDSADPSDLGTLAREIASLRDFLGAPS